MAKVKNAKLLNSVKVVQKESTFLNGADYDMEVMHVDGIGFLKVIAKKEVLYIPMSNVNYLHLREQPSEIKQTAQPSKPQGVSGQQAQNQSRPA